MDLEKLKERVAMRDLASLPYWWERTRDLPVPQPKTVYIPMDPKDLINAMDGEPLDLKPLLAAAEKVGGYPVFLRTDVGAAKKNYKDTCFVESADKMTGHAYHLLDECMAADMFGEAAPHGFAVREFLHLDWSFKAFWGEMPVATEARVFVRDGVVECVHPYWPADAIREWAVRWTDSIQPDWERRLAFQNAKVERDIMTIRHLAERVARVMDGWWSCDLALAVDDRAWYLIDMAPGAASYHDPSCGNAPYKNYPGGP